MKEKSIEKKTMIQRIRENKHNILVTIMIFAILLSIFIYRKYLNVKTTYTVVNGYIEKTTDSVGIVLKNEKVLELNNTEVAIPIVEQNKRVAKGETIAIYKNERYDEYLKTIEELDKSIQSLILDLPASYSNDVSSIDAQITNLAKEARKETSYIKMQEYKTKIDELAYKKVIILGERSPEGSKVRELIEEREVVEKNSLSAETDNIIAPVSGVATYKIDNLENFVNVEDILNFDIEKLEDIISKYKENNASNFGIKIVDNYQAYILIKEEKDKNSEYITIGKSYTLKFGEKDVDSITAKLVKSIEGNEYNYNIFQLNNGIEELVDLRTISTEVVWKKVSGMAVPKTAIQRNEEKGYSYVTLVYGTQYIEVPIKVSIESDNVCIVENLSKEEKEKLGITTTFILELYDKLLIE
ncbi:MAG: HlyD family efflux transporter periplasmic adaptor subunit [Clostridia bacterium]|nr:HlyD family efflux transporter periplasmic adaptor subunit [Clostridia bacterium]